MSEKCDFNGVSKRLEKLYERTMHSVPKLPFSFSAPLKTNIT